MKVGILHTAFIGDLVLVSSLIEELSKDHHQIILFTKNSPALLYKNDKRLLKVVKVNKGKRLQKILSFFKIAKLIRDEKIEVLFVPHRSATSSLCAFFSRTRKTIGFSDSSLSFLYTDAVGLKKKDKDFHEYQKYLSLNILSQNHLTTLPKLLPEQKLPEFEKVFPEFFSQKVPFFIVSPGSVWETKKYPSELFARVILTVLQDAPRLVCILSGGKEDEDDISAVLHSLQNVTRDPQILARVIDASRCLPLNELVSLTSRASFVIVNDSAPLHIASATNTPTIAVFGPTSPYTGFAPLAEKKEIIFYNTLNPHSLLSCQPCSSHGQRSCPLLHHRCMKLLSPDIIISKIKKLLPELF